MKKMLALIMAVLLVLSMAACNSPETPAGTMAANAANDVDRIVKGEGAKSFPFNVVDLDGTETKFLIKTDAETVGEALQALELIDGEEGDYGLYVLSVNGISADWDKEGAWWSFLVDGEASLTGVDSVAIEEGKVYSFVKTKE